MLRKFLLYIATLNKLLFISAVVISNFSTSGWCLFEKVASATVIITKEQDYFQQLKLPNNVEIHISSMFPKSCFDEDGLSDRNECFPITELNLIKGAKKFNNTKTISTNKNWKDVFIYIVKIAPSAYFKDLNNDGYYEIALFPMLAGNAVPSTAYIYSVKDTALEYYGNGLLSWEYLKEADNEKFVFNIKKETK